MEFKEELKEALQEESKPVIIMTVFAIGAFLIALYIFFISYITPAKLGEEALQEQGAVLYALNIANPINIFSGIDPIILIGVLVAVIVIALFAIILVIYSKIGKIKKINYTKENPVSQIQENATPAENFSEYNKKVLELLDEGERCLEKNEYTNARIVYHKIREWYDPHNDKSREIYLRILRFYERIAKEEI